MRYFPLLDFQHVVLALFLGALALVFAAAAWCGYPRREDERPPAPEAPEPPEVGQNPVGPFLVLVYTSVAAGALGYAIVAWLLGKAVGY